MAHHNVSFDLSVQEIVDSIEYNNLHLSSEEVRSLSAEIIELERQGVIQKQKSDYKNPIYLNPDPNDPYKLLVDFSNLNKVIVHKDGCLPKAKNLWPSFRNKKFFSTLKLNCVYYQIPIAKESKPLTGFILEDEEYVFNRLAPGMSGCENTLQLTMEKVFDDMLYEKVVVYLDTIYVLGETIIEQSSNLKRSLQRIQSSNLTLKPSDCSFSQESVELLGYRILNNKLKMSNKMLAPIKKSACPKTLKELFEFVVAAKFYSEMIKGFARLAAPLTDFFEKPQPLTRDLQLQIKHEMCYEMLKQKLLMKPVLTIFDHNAEIILCVTASRIAIEGDLYQIDSKTRVKHAVGFYSEKVRTDEKNWDLFDLEMLAIVESCQYFEAYLKKCQFTVHSTNPPEIYEINFKEPSARLKLLKSKIDDFSFKVRLVSEKAVEFYEFTPGSV